MYAELITAALALAPTTLVPRKTTAVCTDNVKCPMNDGCSSTTPNGAAFQMKCSTDFNGPVIEINEAATFIECMTACSVFAGCKGLNYKDKFCYLLGDVINQGPTATNTHVNAATQTHAATTDLSPTPGTNRCNYAITCPASDGCWYEFNDEKYRVRCGFDFYGGDLTDGNSRLPNLKACIINCMDRKECVGVSYNSSNRQCYLKGTLKPAIYNSKVSTAFIIGK